MRNISLADFDAWHRPESVAVPIVFGIIFLIGVVGNGTLLHIISWNRRMKTAPNAYIFNIALGDFLVMVASVPFTATTYTFREWPYEEIVCKLSQSVHTISLAITAFSLSALAIERFRAITSKRYIKGKPNSFLCGTITFAWVFALLLGIPDAMSAYVKRYETSDGFSMQFCLPRSPAWGNLYAKIFSVVKFGITFAVPLVIVTFCYCLIGCYLVKKNRLENKTKKDAEDTTGDTDEKPVIKDDDEKKKRKHPRALAKLVMVITAVFVLCLLPRHVYLLKYDYWQDDFDHFWRVFEIIGFCLAFVNSCINPVIIYFVDRRFRHQFQRYLFCCCFSRPRSTKKRHHRHHRKDDVAKWRRSQGQDAVRRQKGYGKMNGYQSDYDSKYRTYPYADVYDRKRRHSNDDRYYGNRDYSESPRVGYRGYESDARIYDTNRYYVKNYDELDGYRLSQNRHPGTGRNYEYSDTYNKRRGFVGVETFPSRPQYEDNRPYTLNRYPDSSSYYHGNKQDNLEKNEYAPIRKNVDIGNDQEVAVYTSHMNDKLDPERSESTTPVKVAENDRTTPKETMSKELYL